MMRSPTRETEATMERRPSARYLYPGRGRGKLSFGTSPSATSRMAPIFSQISTSPLGPESVSPSLAGLVPAKAL